MMKEAGFESYTILLVTIAAIFGTDLGKQWFFVYRRTMIFAKPTENLA